MKKNETRSEDHGTDRYRPGDIFIWNLGNMGEPLGLQTQLHERTDLGRTESRKDVDHGSL